MVKKKFKVPYAIGATVKKGRKTIPFGEVDLTRDQQPKSDFALEVGEKSFLKQKLIVKEKHKPKGEKHGKCIVYDHNTIKIINYIEEVKMSQPETPITAIEKLLQAIIYTEAAEFTRKEIFIELEKEFGVKNLTSVQKANYLNWVYNTLSRPYFPLLTKKSGESKEVKFVFNKELKKHITGMNFANLKELLKKAKKDGKFTEDMSVKKPEKGEKKVFDKAAIVGALKMLKALAEEAGVEIEIKIKP